jgi:gliding motility-associated-like protein
MNWNKIVFICFFCVGFSPSITAQFITVNDQYTAQDLVENVLVNSPCATVENFSIVGDPFSGTQNSYGFFDATGTSFPFQNGIVLSTARATRSPGPNNNLIDEGALNWTGDSDLEQALGISSTFNATILEFDFTPLTDLVSFDYLFASEEYQGTAPCKYSDGFAFLLKKANSQDAYKNLAVLPSTNLAVSLFTVRPQIGNGSAPNGCSAENPEYFAGFNGANSPINFNGQTIVLKAQSIVIPNVKYHIKLVVADHENIRYDSAVFLSGGSFKVGTDLGLNRLISTGNPLCKNQTLPLNATIPGTTFYNWYKNNQLDNLNHSGTYTVSQAGNYRVEIPINGTSCIAIGEINIEYAADLNPTATTLFQCDDNNDGTTVFNLLKADNLIVANDPTLLSPIYYENITDTTPLTTPNAYQAINNKVIYAKVFNGFGCYKFIDITLKINNNSLVHPAPFEICDNENIKDGFVDFDLNAQVSSVVLNNLPSGLVVKYYLTPYDALSEINELPTIFRNTTAFSQTIWAKILNGADCFGLTPVNLVVNTLLPHNFQDETLYLCDNASKYIQVDAIYSSYVWDDILVSKTNQIKITSARNYIVKVTDSNGCGAEKKFIVLPSSDAKIIDVEVSDFNENSNSIQVIYNVTGDFEFSLDGQNFQSSPIFNNLKSGYYTVYMNDINGCLPDKKDFFVLDYPKYFTPNNDGINDFWKINYLQFQPNAVITIFNQFGKVIFNSKGKTSGWDGRYNSSPLPSADYWFVLNLEDGRIIKGHFALKR